ncbi:MAG: TIGR01777 family oxidoreductase [Frankiaceae bacterium]|nr:TIGR01777 family oxidoreductase [Frankiaceae bacterium]
MKIVVTGSTGLIGTALVRSLRADGHEVRRLVRREPTGADETRWDPAAHSIDAGALDGIDAVVHLAGVGVGDKRWSESHKKAILDSRVDGTTTIATAIAANADHVKTFICGSAVGFYGDRGDETLDESAKTGAGFLAEVVRQWEAATKPASDAGVRVVNLRTGIVLSPQGGALGKVLPIFKLGLGGKLGSGQQWMPWIAIADEVAAIKFLLTQDSISGPVNVCAPEPVRNAEYTAALGRALNRPAVAPVPRFALQLALGGFADEGPLVSQRVIPRRLLDAGFDFTFIDVDSALQSML